MNHKTLLTAIAAITVLAVACEAPTPSATPTVDGTSTVDTGTRPEPGPQSPVEVGLSRFDPMLEGVNGWSAIAVTTVGEPIGGVVNPGSLSGLTVQPRPNGARIFVSHELPRRGGPRYRLDNGAVLRGARITAIEIDGNGAVLRNDVAYGELYNRQGELVSSPEQLDNEGLRDFAELTGVFGKTRTALGFRDDLVFTGEQNNSDLGGTVFVLDVDGSALHAAPALGRMGVTNVAPLTPADGSTVALLMADHSRSRAPVYLYLGQKDAVGDGSFLDRNGLAKGALFVFVANNEIRFPGDFTEAGSHTTGRFVRIPYRDAGRAGQDGVDADGWFGDDMLRGLAGEVGAFTPSRPSDLDTDPRDPTRVVITSAGQGDRYPADDFGTVYVMDVDGRYLRDGFDEIPSTLTIVYDGDEHDGAGIRSPQSVLWSADGFVYVQEDANTQLVGFGDADDTDASIWRLDVSTATPQRIAVIDRSAVPSGLTDENAGTPYVWASSGMIEVTGVLGDGTPAFLTAVLARGLTGGAVSELSLGMGGQLLFLRPPA